MIPIIFFIVFTTFGIVILNNHIHTTKTIVLLIPSLLLTFGILNGAWVINDVTEVVSLQREHATFSYLEVNDTVYNTIATEYNASLSQAQSKRYLHPALHIFKSKILDLEPIELRDENEIV